MRPTNYCLLLFMFALCLTGCHKGNKSAQQWKVFETSFESSKDYGNPFVDVQVDVLFKKDGKSWNIPAFWDGGTVWKVRFAPPEVGAWSYRVVSSDKSNPGLNGDKHSLTVTRLSRQ